MAHTKEGDEKKIERDIARIVSQGEIDDIIGAFKTFLQVFLRIKADNEEHRRALSASAKSLEKEMRDAVEKAVKSLVAKVESKEKGKDGYTPLAGVDYPNVDQIREMMEGMRPETPVEGVHYFIPKLDDIVRKCLTMLRPASFAKMLFSAPNNVITAVNQADNQIKADRVEGLEKFMKDMKKGLAAHFFAGAPGQAISTPAWKTPGETVNGSTTVFTVGSQVPTDVIADGVQYFQGKGYSYASDQITFDIAPSQYVRYR